ncbi:thioesterase domain-containing protein [Shigella flexneri]
MRQPSPNWQRLLMVKRTPGAWDSKPYCVREGNKPTLVFFHPASGFSWQFSVLSRYINPQWSIIGIQSPRPHGPVQTATNCRMKSAEAHLATLLGQDNRAALITCWGIRWAVRWRGSCGAAACPWLQTGGISWLAGSWPPETQNWQKRS